MTQAIQSNSELLLDAARQAPALCLILDYDGTLTPIRPLPALAQPDADLLAVLQSLCERPDRTVHIVSGRLRTELDRWLGSLSVGLHAEHGVWSRDQPHLPWRRNVPAVDAWPSELVDALRQSCAMLPGSLLETKTASLAFHFRNVRRDWVASTVPSLRNRLAGLAATHRLVVMEGSEVIEIMAQQVSKGNVVRSIAQRLAPGTAVIAMGDDTTDEEMFRALPPEALTVRVGVGASVARYRMEGPAQVRAALASWV